MSAIGSRAASFYNTVTVASQQISGLIDGRTYRLVSSIDTWVAVGANPTASAANDSHFLSAGRELLIRAAATGDKVAVLRVAAVDGVCTLSILLDVF